MTLANRLLELIEHPGFDRLKRLPRKGWQLWLSDGTKQIHEGETLADVIAKAEAHLGKGV